MNVKSKTHLMTPGPVCVHPDILNSLSQPMVHHLSQEFQTTLARVLEKLKTLFVTNRPVFMHTSTGSGAMESAVVNTLSAGDAVLVIESGKFGERWADICENYGLNVERWQVEWGNAADPKELKQKLAKKSFKALLTQACESSTGVLHPIEEMGAVCKNYSDTLFMVDGISSVGALKLPMDSWGIDCLVTGSQKALMLPAGLAFISLSEKAWNKAQSAKLPKYYWDLKEELSNNQKGRTRFSSSVSLVRALEVSLDLVLKNGLDHQLHQVSKKSQATCQAGEAFGLKVFAKSPSPCLTAFALPEKIDGKKLLKDLESKKIFLAGGQDHLVGKVVRIGHMGYIENEDVVYVLDQFFTLLIKTAPDIFSENKKKTALDLAAKIVAG